MHESRRPYGQARSIIRKPYASDAFKPKRHEPLKPGKEREVPIDGLPHLTRFEVVSSSDD